MRFYQITMLILIFRLNSHSIRASHSTHFRFENEEGKEWLSETVCWRVVNMCGEIYRLDTFLVRDVRMLLVLAISQTAFLFDIDSTNK